ncbi:MAG TPA: ribosome biogenesis GTP-binding protein YihA/YsxC [Bacillota bacterium]|jgi:GTP-binding protein|nr:ribosome biogenesis GTP-binding protein YihA/YsxC [Peptococcaceae bacterium MAG4]NLW38763.1 YihA family ribosome biogenesis GTP-binding protein [Peptococcaceae bacterium]HPU35778.1 ribosome biogenesis GTP-binding protein YihA/YsxC [Bacillota bacterium]HPZ43367.1 ribosome biogenesis GTP-binding protein YihA/YsxC [Bacillota bacterium]HQD76511.1 ribosome biogenesis GTP-binding protein YihA/YsxC [Bacillota bacterium]
MKISRAEFIKSAVHKSEYPAGELPEVALAGRSNVGKSSLLNRLAVKKGLARTSKTPGRTRLINFFLINGIFRLVDLPGYGYAKVSAGERESWRKMVEDYLSTRENLKGVVLLVDSRHPPTSLDVQMYDWLKHRGIPVAVVATKADKLSRSKLLRSLKVVRETLALAEGEILLPFSAETGQGREELMEVIGRWTGVLCEETKETVEKNDSV